MKFHKDIAPEYQKGYHKIFLPLVKLSKTNKIVKKILEHIAVHSTIDMRQATRGKTYLLGRVYRKILVPICYLVGKYDQMTKDALQKIESHEKLCRIMQKQTHEKMKQLENQITRVERILLVSMGAVMTGMGGVIIVLIEKL